MKQKDLASKLLLCIVSCLLINSCKNPEIPGIYWPKNPKLIELELWNHSFELFKRVDQSKEGSDMITFKRVSFLKGTYSFNHNKLILYDSINHKNHYFEVIDDETLICNSEILCLKPNDTLVCKEKSYPDYKLKWEEGSGDTIFVRSYYNREGFIVKDIYYDRRRKIVRVIKHKR